MTDNATPKRRPRPNYSRPTKYPAGLSIMTTAEQRAEVDERVKARDETIGVVTRGLLADGSDLDRAYESEPGLREDVQRLARESGVPVSDALATMLRFAVRESERRLRRNAAIAHEIGAGLGEMGFMVDGVTVGGIDLEARG